MNEAQAILVITDLIVNCGVPTAIRLIQTLNAEAVSIEDLQALKDKGLKDPESYFGGSE